MANLLPARSLPPNRIVERAHHPRGRDYRSFTRCLRWEFGFQCAFCLRHEYDLNPYGVRRSAYFWVEHLERQELTPELINDYANCFYACRHCNRARGTKPTRDPISRCRLLDPCSSVWSKHFTLKDHRLEPVAGDADARYTALTYEINSHDKVKRRETRAAEYQANHKRWRSIDAEREHVEQDRLSDDAQLRSRASHRMRQLLSNHADLMQRQLRFSAIPHDAEVCGCRTRDEALRNSRPPPHIEYETADRVHRERGALDLRWYLGTFERIAILVSISPRALAILNHLCSEMVAISASCAITLLIAHTEQEPTAEQLDELSRRLPEGDHTRHTLQISGMAPHAVAAAVATWSASQQIELFMVCDGACGCAAADVVASLKAEELGDAEPVEWPDAQLDG